MTNADISKKTTVLMILDGFGHRTSEDHNAVRAANTPVLDRLWQEAPHSLVSGSGLDVGLPEGQMGNSEVGHMSLGSGRIIYQSITRIDKALKDGSFETNSAYTDAIDSAVSGNKAVHILGLLSPGGVHSHENHLFAALRLAASRGAREVYLHAFLDGRDTPPRSARASLQAAEAVFDELGTGRIATIHGRYWAMDRDNRWDRIERSYRLLTSGDSEASATDALSGLDQAYERGENDEFVTPTAIGESAVINDGDAVLFMNFRADRARQLSEVFLSADFSGFQRTHWPKCHFVTTTEYASSLPCPVAFPPDNVIDSLGEIIAKEGKTQLRIAETEKYAHVTFFFSGGRESEFDGETRKLIPSPDVATYDLQPEMSAREVTDQLVEAIESRSYDFIVVNFANGDMVGHTGVYPAAIKAVEVLDECIGRVEKALLATGGEGLVTADHGNCEQMLDYDNQQPHTQHTTERVPFIYIGARAAELSAKPGILADIAPTVLELMGLPQPLAMTGESLLHR
ncbi:2,3-bisphosphoglycerate-independent phosphoglycerate mutase [Luminiphilus syltensis NOR5-1B]|uniref:2,3-bisphosphoglycerate-independent phosphoglycerate mutase n=1 Tax=Luminiphilus syltensis NOR5-1B TaxID=565045 RepID=B8KUN9_9GAMM|nr:2,3-bisphosphoglycerate-independent phosphoglycerate mutase [Luminiphilus syltensis]EED35513.1 2,3-bisphosphoglycerate-independent phosphoglycerate mutase [Luminiphilus syltensis NOR5-1B]